MLTPAAAAKMRTPERVAQDIENAIDDAVNTALDAPYFPMWEPLHGHWIVVLTSVKGPDDLMDEVVARFTKSAAELGWRVVGPTNPMTKYHLIVEPI